MKYTRVRNFTLFPSNSAQFNFFLESISCVRWDPSGNFLASSSEDKTIQLLDYRIGKAIYSGPHDEPGNFIILTLD